MKVEDNYGRIWHVESGDPAHQFVNALKRLNYSYIVLTVPLLCGIIQPQPASPTVTLDGVSASSPEQVVRAVRLLDCIDALTEEGLLGTV